MTDLPEPLLRYFAARQEQRANAVTDFLAALTDRERALIKDTAVMGYVRGRMHPQDEEHPKDSAVLAEVVDACLAHPDLYPAVNAVAATAPQPETASGTDGLRERIAAALLGADTYAQLERREDRERFADAVLAVLAEPAGAES